MSFSLGRRVALATLVGLVAGGACAHVTGCHQAPAPVRPVKANAARDVESMTEIAIGRVLEGLMQMSSSEYADPALSEYVTAVGVRIAKRSERPDLPWHFQVVDSPEMSAQALPGGRVTISRGLLAFLGSEAELAAILAHEIAHVAFRHSHSKWSKSVPVEEAGEAAETRKRQRDSDEERQADSVGARYLAEAGYAPRAVVEALSALDRGARQSSAKEAAPSDDDDFDPHPAPPARIARAAVAAGSAGGDWGRERYLVRVAGLEWGDASTALVLAESKGIMPGELSFDLPHGYHATSDHGLLKLKAGAAAEDSLVAFRLPRSFVSESLKASITKGRHTKRDVAGIPAVVARSLDATTEVPKKKDDVLMAILDGKTGVLVVATTGSSLASERVLDEILASVRRETSAHRARPVLVMERTDAKGRFDDFIRRRCPSTPLDLASALNGRSATSELAPATTIKCVKTR